MGHKEIRTALKVDLNKPAWEQPGLHNRWHPDIPSCGKISNNEVVKIECLDWMGGQIKNSDSADDIKNCDLTQIHFLSGPFDIDTAKPGDVLCVEVLDLHPFPEQPWGYTGVFDKMNGGGLLEKHYPKAAKAIWDFEGIFCTSRHIPHVHFPGIVHAGIMGTAPSPDLLAEWNRREEEFMKTTELGPEVTKPPEPRNTLAGNVSEDVRAKIAKEGARTIPGRPEHGGNSDIKNVSRGSKSYFPVYVAGAKFSIGDLHFSQGDGEISFCGAIEMAGIVTLKFSVIPQGMTKLCLKSPMFTPGIIDPQFGANRYLTFQGYSVDETGKQQLLDATIAYRQASLRAIEYLRRYGYNDYQIYLLLSGAPIEGHIGAVVDVLNGCTTLGVPMDIFDFDIRPEAEVVKRDMGSCAFPSK